jgi:hypothetical protein
MVAVFVGVMLTGLFRMMHGVNVMALRHVRVMTGLVVVTGVVMLRRRLVVLSGVLVVFGSFAMVLRRLL